MKKMMLLASVVALAVMMLAAAPAFAQNVTEINGFRFIPGDCGNREGTDLTQEEAEELLREEGFSEEEIEDLPDAGNVCLLDDGDDGNGNGNGNGDDDGDDDDDRDRRDRDRDRDRDNVADVVPVFEITQETEQECDSGDVDQSVNVSQDGDNSIQTVGAQPTANTGCAQNALGVIDAGPFVGDFAGDRIFVEQEDDDNGDDNGHFFLCDEDGDGNNDDDCDDFDDGRVFCDRDNDGNDDGDDECFVFDHDNGDDDNDNDRVIIRDRGDQFNVGDVGGEFEIEDVNSTIDVSPNQTVTGGGTINQTASAESDTFVVKHPYPYGHWYW
jgi:hypothetical protein